MPIFADLHCHPSFKPYGQTFTDEHERPAGVTSMWHTTEPTGTDRLLTNAIGAAMFTQSDLRSAVKGGLQVIGLSVGALEKEFITISTGGATALATVLSGITHTDMENFMCNVITRVGRARIKLVHDTQDYFTDLGHEIDFIKAQQQEVYEENGSFYKFELVRNGSQVRTNLERNAIPGAGGSLTNPIIISITLSVEGMHNLDANHGRTPEQVLDNVTRLKAMAPFFFVTYCHHFWNGLCGHAPSLTNMMRMIFNQEKNWKTGFTPLGAMVLKRLLDKNAGGHRILIDIKHLSVKARRQYFSMLQGSIPDDIGLSASQKAELGQFFRFNNNDGSPDNPPPPIASHAAMNGYRSQEDKHYFGNYPHAAGGVVSPFENLEFYDDPSINLYDEDLQQIIRFRGIVGIQLDKRRMADKIYYEHAEGSIEKYQAFLIWNQILHAVELWDREGAKDAWDHICIGSDFDGIINPMDGLNRLDHYPTLREGLLYYCSEYMKPTAEFTVNPKYAGMGQRGTIANRHQQSRDITKKRLQQPENCELSPEEIIDKICYKNAVSFMEKYFV